jgi:hypothetical protein
MWNRRTKETMRRNVSEDVVSIQSIDIEISKTKFISTQAAAGSSLLLAAVVLADFARRFASPYLAAA